MFEQMAKRKQAGLSYAAIGKEFGVSRQRVQEVLSPSSVVKTAVCKRAKGCCERCRTAVERGHLHHRRYDVSLDVYNTAANLQYLCVSCHGALHHSLAPPKRRVTQLVRTAIFSA